MQILIKIRTKGRDNYSNNKKKKNVYVTTSYVTYIYDVRFTTHNNRSELSGI